MHMRLQVTIIFKTIQLLIMFLMNHFNEEEEKISIADQNLNTVTLIVTKKKTKILTSKELYFNDGQIWWSFSSYMHENKNEGKLEIRVKRKLGKSRPSNPALTHFLTQ